MKGVIAIALFSVLGLRTCVHFEAQTNRAYISDDIEGVWYQTNDKLADMVELRKKDDYWLWAYPVKNMENRKGVGITFHNYDGKEFACYRFGSLLSEKDKLNEPDAYFVRFKWLDNQSFQLFPVEFVNDEYETIFYDTPKNLQESLFIKYLDKGAVYVSDEAFNTFVKAYDLKD